MQATTVHTIRALVRGRRRDLGLSQETLARSAGTSRKWLSEFERGTTTAVELPLVLRVLAALDLTIDIDVTESRTASAQGSAEQERNGEVDLDDVLRNYASRGRQ